MRSSRAMVLVRGAAMTAIAVLGAGSAVVAPAAVSALAPAAGAAVQVVPFATGHIVAAGGMAQPPTTAECDADFGIAC